MYRVHSYISGTQGEHNTTFYRYSGTGSRAPSVDSHYDTTGCVVACDHCLPISVYVFPPLSFQKKRKKTPDRKLALWIQEMVPPLFSKEREKETPDRKLVLWVQEMVIYAVQILCFPYICHDTGIVIRKHVMR